MDDIDLAGEWSAHDDQVSARAPRAMGGNSWSLAATALQALIRSVTRRIRAYRSPSYSPRLRRSWLRASILQTSRADCKHVRRPETRCRSIRSRRNNPSGARPRGTERARRCRRDRSGFLANSPLSRRRECVSGRTARVGNLLRVRWLPGSGPTRTARFSTGEGRASSPITQSLGWASTRVTNALSCFTRLASSFIRSSERSFGRAGSTPLPGQRTESGIVRRSRSPSDRYRSQRCRRLSAIDH